MTETEPTKPTYPTKLAESRLFLDQSGQMQNLWFAQPEAGTPFDATLKPSYWAHVAKKLRAPDEVKLMPDDGAWYARVLVLFVGPVEAKIAKLDYRELDAVDPDALAAGNYSVKWISAAMGYQVVNQENKPVAERGFRSKADAAAWMAEHLKALAV